MTLNFKRRSRIKPDIAMTPLIDAAFILILFFAVTMNVSKAPTGVTVQTAAGKTAETKSSNAIITVTAAGAPWAYFNATPVASPGQLTKMILDNKEQTGKFLIRPDKAVKYETLMEILDIVRLTAGRDADIALAMEIKDGQGAAPEKEEGSDGQEADEAP
jgi:biopolymer transport protein ExbD